MREIKVRAFAVVSKVMFLPDNEDGWEVRMGVISAIPNTILMQYTGLKDKNGVGIYEGDILGNKADKYNYQIQWNTKNACWEIGDGKAGMEKCQVGLFWEVIGNIYENPELLEREGTKTVQIHDEEDWDNTRVVDI